MVVVGLGSSGGILQAAAQGQKRGGSLLVGRAREGQVARRGCSHPAGTQHELPPPPAEGALGLRAATWEMGEGRGHRPTPLCMLHCPHQRGGFPSTGPHTQGPELLTLPPSSGNWTRMLVLPGLFLLLLCWLWQQILGYGNCLDYFFCSCVCVCEEQTLSR